MNVNISKRNLIVILMLVLFFVTAYTFVFSTSMKKQIESFKDELMSESTHKCESEYEKDVFSGNEASQSYKILEHDKKIGIYSTESDELLKVLDVFVVTLPRADQEMLKNGIYAASEKELISLVEDYTS